MSTLSGQQCDACRVDAPRVTSEEQHKLLGELEQWSVVEEQGIAKLVKSYAFSNFVQAMSFAQAVALLAEEQGHHPALLTEWGRVTVYWWTHKIQGLHRDDFIMAAKTDALSID